MTPVEMKRKAEQQIEEILNRLVADGLMCKHCTVSAIDTTSQEDHRRHYMHNVKLDLSVVDTEF